MDRLFLDANILFSAAYRPDARMRRLWTMDEVELVTSSHVVTEARRNLPASRHGDLDNLLRSLTIIAVDETRLTAEWPDIDLIEKDRPVLRAAIQAQATHLITGDVRHFGQFFGQRLYGVLVLPPAAYLRGAGETEQPM